MPKAVMGKSVILEIGKGCFETGFPVTLEAWLGGDRPDAKILGQLPPSPTLPQFYNNWQSAYLAFKAVRRIQKKQEAKENNYSDAEIKQAAAILKENLNKWLNSSEFCKIRERLLKSLDRLVESDELLLILQTQDSLLRRLPWHLWDLLEDYSQRVEVALSAPNFERIVQAGKVKEKIRILAVFGDSTHINTKPDKQVIENLCCGEIDSVFLPQPSKQELNEHLWDEQGWDILFFAGHSSSQANGKNGCIYLKPNEKLTVSELEYALKTSIEHRLIEYAPRHKTSLEIPIDLARTSKANDLRSILDDIGLEVGAIKPYSPESVAQAIVECLNSRNVILIFKNAHNLPEDDLNNLINFWSNTLANLYRNRSYNYRLLMFLVDGRGNLNLKRNFASDFQKNWMPDMPVLLQIQNDFSQPVLTEWFNKLAKILMPEAINLLRQDTQFILGSNRNDLPEFMMKKICLLCSCNWSLIQSWLRT
ncbi:hypothetical protein [Kamptonema sp. UHCC 0994]|uniref:hypothetical protein n=1 Tax=Kamptonema sp. UHCC 0994 TaxID=3031329 RepID=UPI0023B8F2D8|nr:hypothetical protein [Kamptonema sp. UHCC 0994]MDF0555632.1 hypothetical protein [Kamptonema sp. UHCC 0994]